MNCYFRSRNMDYGPHPYVLNVNQAAAANQNFRTAVWTGENLQMTLMSIPTCGEIGWENHTDTDQHIRVEQGNAILQMGECSGQVNFEKRLGAMDAVFVPAGTWHNIVNAGRCPLKVSSIYAPPHHPRGTVQQTKEDAGKNGKCY